MLHTPMSWNQRLGIGYGPKRGGSDRAMGEERSPTAPACHFVTPAVSLTHSQRPEQLRTADEKRKQKIRQKWVFAVPLLGWANSGCATAHRVHKIAAREATRGIPRKMGPEPGARQVRKRAGTGRMTPQNGEFSLFFIFRGSNDPFLVLVKCSQKRVFLLKTIKSTPRQVCPGAKIRQHNFVRRRR